MLNRVGINLLYLVPGQVGGTEIYARELLPALAAESPQTEFMVYLGNEANASLAAEAGQSWPANITLRHVAVACSNKPLRIATELGRLPRIAGRDKVDLLHSLGTTTPAHGTFARVVTVHDLIYRHFPNTFPAAARAGLNVIVPRGARRADRVIADSKATKQDVVSNLGVDAEKVDVVYLGLGSLPSESRTPENALRAKLELGDRRVVLTVSAALEHKNLDRLIRAMRHTRGVDGNDPALVIVGHAGRELDRLNVIAKQHGVFDRLRFTGWIEQPDLEGLYALADCFAYPSLHEGFGMPVLEAMRRGTAVTCSNTTSLPEVAGDAALLFDPTDDRSIATAINQLLDDSALVEMLIAKGKARAEQFTWQRCAAETLACYKRALPGYDPA